MSTSNEKIEKTETNKESAWKKHKDWKKRYSNIYKKQVTKAPEDDAERWHRISFMTEQNTPYTELLMKVRANRRDSSSTSPSPQFLTSMLSRQSDLYGTYTGTGSMLSDQTLPLGSTFNDSISDTGLTQQVSNDLGEHDTLLLDMVRRSRELQCEAEDQMLDMSDDDNISDDQSIGACVQCFNMRMTERSVSRSRVSRISTRRDMDIPSILAFTTSNTPSVHLGIPAFLKHGTPQQEKIPKWSIRRSVCPVCSQKWKDKSSINNIKYSGLKRNTSSDLPSVIAPARLRSSITMGYIPRPVIATLDQEAGITAGGFRNSSATWQLTRARRFRSPKSHLLSLEANAPPKVSAPLAKRDLNLRVSRFLTNKALKN